MQAKATSTPFKSALHSKSNRIGQLLHSDLGGPVITLTADGERYYRTILDDYSHFCVVYLLKSKSEAAENMICFIRELEAEKGNIHPK